MKDENIKILTQLYRKITIPDCFVELDLGCGKGSFTTALADKFPDRYVLAADIMLGRLRKLDKRRQRMGLTNLELLRTEAGILINCFIPTESIDRLHLLCPDPWPKHKHKGNRLVSSEFVSRISLVLKKNGIFHFSTDDETYFNSVLKVVGRSGLFSEIDISMISDIADIKTDFEFLWESEGKKVNHLAWQKLDKTSILN